MASKVGKIYIGIYDKKRKNGLLKIGQTFQGVGTRASQISQSNGSHFTVLKCAEFKNISKEELTFVESCVRMEMSKVKGLSFVNKKNDHFEYTIDRTSNQIQDFLKNFDKSIDKATKMLYN